MECGRSVTTDRHGLQLEPVGSPGEYHEDSGRLKIDG